MSPKPLPGNPHAPIATARLHETPATARDTAVQVQYMADALTQATLANAYEQRTANLLQLEVLMAGGTGRGRRGALERIGERMEEQEAR